MLTIKLRQQLTSLAQHKNRGKDSSLPGPVKREIAAVNLETSEQTEEQRCDDLCQTGSGVSACCLAKCPTFIELPGASLSCDVNKNEY